jgi:hypothetical protein
MKLYHCTDAGDEIQSEGFWDSMASGPRGGVFLRDQPTFAGVFAFEIDVPDELAEQYRAADGAAEWCIPAALVNMMPRRRIDD